jgi:predicted phage terminase large subunit-like protein
VIPGLPGAPLVLGPLPSRKQLKGERMRRSLSAFFRESWHILEPATPLVWGKHIEVICDEVQAVLEEWRAARKEQRAHRFQNLLINVPPGTAKSRICSVAAPAWMWIESPDWRLISISGNPRVAVRDSMYRRQIISSDWYQEHFRPLWRLRDASRGELEEMVDPEGVQAISEAEQEMAPLLGWELAKDQNAKSLFKNSAGGFMLAISIGAKITGDRGDALEVDDPNDVAKSASKVDLENVNDAWKAAGNRLNDMRLGVRIAVQQRVASEDFSAQAIRDGDWRHVRLPAIYDAANDCKCPSCVRGDVPDWRAKEGAEPNLLPDRFSEAVLAAEKRRLGSAGFSAQYFQNPIPADGGMFKKRWWRYWRRRTDPPQLDPELARVTVTLPDHFDEVIQSWDCTFKDTKGSDYVVGQVWGRVGASKFLLDQVRGRMEFTACLVAVRNLTARWPMAHAKLVEGKANGPAVISVLRKEVSGLIDVDPGRSSKEERAAAVTPQVEAGDVYLPDPALVPWVDEYIEEHAGFPGAHDDQVDATSQALTRLEKKASTVQWSGITQPRRF